MVDIHFFFFPHNIISAFWMLWNNRFVTAAAHRRSRGNALRTQKIRCVAQQIKQF